MKRISLALAIACLVSAAWAAPGNPVPGNVTDLLASGNRLLQKGQLEPAQQAFLAATQADPRSVEARMRLAGVQIARNDFTAAIKNYQKAIGLDPNNAKAYIGLGIAYMHGGDRDLTRAALNEAMRIEPQRKAQLAPIMAMLDTPELEHAAIH